MKTLADLQAIRESKLQELHNRREHDGPRVVVGMATCGIAAGARPVLQAFMSEIAKSDLKDVMIQQMGCIGMCRLEPIVEIFRGSEDKVTYVHMTPDKVARVVSEHLVNGRPVMEYTIGAAEQH
nr:(2Fe-2S) ferredoxin domain-containing protein [bacterium]